MADTIDPIQLIEDKVVDQVQKHADLMLYGRLTYLQRRSQDVVIQSQILELEKKLGINPSSEGSGGAVAGDTVKDPVGGGSSDAKPPS